MVPGNQASYVHRLHHSSAGSPQNKCFQQVSRIYLHDKSAKIQSGEQSKSNGTSAYYAAIFPAA